MRIITNTNRPDDRMDLLIKNESVNTEIFIATAFFSNENVINHMISNGCHVSMVVRLGIGTNPDALLKFVDNNNVDIRFFTGKNFHPKLYIFGNRIAYLGSSNFTISGLTTNQEINIEIDSEEPAFLELNDAFYEYWDSAEVLTKEIAQSFKTLMKDIRPVDPFRKIFSEIGEFEFNNVGKTGTSRTKNEVFISNFKRSYQRYISRFNILKDFYYKEDKRRFPTVPLRIEVDRFLWWVREYKAKGESYKRDEVKNDSEIRNDLRPLISEFVNFESNYLQNDAVQRYINLKNGFANENQIFNMEFDNLYKTLFDVHAFHDRFRFFEGGHDRMKEVFFELNEEKRVKDSIEYLLFDPTDYETKIFNCLYNDKYKLNGFGESCVKELYGVINDSDVPICNGRTLKSMEWLGFGKL